jgi:hypothetical protein
VAREASRLPSWAGCGGFYYGRGTEKQEKIPRDNFERVLSTLFSGENSRQVRPSPIIRLLFANMLWFPQVL